jgi:hypothetical protein
MSSRIACGQPKALRHKPKFIGNRHCTGGILVHAAELYAERRHGSLHDDWGLFSAGVRMGGGPFGERRHLIITIGELEWVAELNFRA